jgi:hypothetical protein
VAARQSALVAAHEMMDLRSFTSPISCDEFATG